MTTKPDHPEIYRTQAERYEALVSREDHQGNLLPALRTIADFEGRRVVDLGAGTGRVSCLLVPLVEEVLVIDHSKHMLEVATAKLRKSGYHNWKIEASDHRKIPIPDHSVDVVVSGWSVCYVVVDNPETWQIELEKVFEEIGRILKLNGTIILIETLGTGYEEPHPPEHLMEYYKYLRSNGFSESSIRTDYRFETLEIAQSLSGFFFGDAMQEKLVHNENEILLPECTGIWWKRRQ